MAVLEVKVPQLSESVSEATLLHWHKSVGEAVKRDENLVDIETDKVVMELPAPSAGVISQVYKKDGESVVAGEVIATIDTEMKATVKAPEEASVSPAPIPAASVSATPVVFSASQPTQAAIGDVRVMPAAARMLAEHELDSSMIVPTGKDGRITKQDVIGAIEDRDLQAMHARERITSAPRSAMETQAQFATGSVDRTENRVPMSRLRARIAERLVESQQTNAALTTFNEVNMQPIIDLRRKFSEQFEKEHGVRLGFMSFFMKAAVAALKKFPIVNASIDENDIVYHGYYDIGIAISSPRGLVVPIMRDVDLMSIADIEKKIAEFNVQARDGRLTLDDLTGGTFSISNGGVFGSMLSTPIINPPQSAILGIHATKERVVVENGEMVIRPMNYLALSYDHRLIDGREAVLALVAIKETLEDPSRLLLDL